MAPFLRKKEKKEEPVKGGKRKLSGAVRLMKNIYEEGLQYEKNGNVDKAILNYRRILRHSHEYEDELRTPDDKKEASYILVKAGERLYALDDKEKAVSCFERAKDLYDGNAKAWLYIAKDLLSMNLQIPYAMGCLKKAAKYDPKNPEVWIYLGDAYRLQNMTQEAINAYQEALKYDPENEAIYMRIMKLNPTDVEVLKKLAEILEKKGAKEELLHIYRRLARITSDETYVDKAFAISPGDPELMLEKARILIERGNLDDAEAILKEAVEKNPDLTEAKLLLEDIALQKGAGLVEEVKEKEELAEELFGDLSFGEEEVEDIAIEEINIEIEDLEEGNVEEAMAPLPEMPTAPPAEAKEEAKAEEVKVEEAAAPSGEAAPEAPAEAPPAVEEKPEVEAPAVEEAAPPVVEASAGEAAQAEEGTPPKAPPTEEVPEAEEAPVVEEKVAPAVEEVKPEVEAPLEEGKPEEVVPAEKATAPAEEVPAEAPPPETPVEEAPAPVEEVDYLAVLKEAMEAKDEDRVAEAVVKIGVEKALEQYRGFEDLWFITEALLEKGEMEIAEHVVNDLIEVSDHDDARILKAKVMSFQGKYEEAEKILNDVIRRNMKNGLLWFEKARIAARKGEGMKAKNFLTMALKLRPDLKPEVEKDEALKSVGL